MQCPRCFNDNTSIINNSHYVCNNPNCVDENGNRTQFYFVPDENIMFPYNQIFINRNKNEFYRKQLLKMRSIDNHKANKI